MSLSEDIRAWIERSREPQTVSQISTGAGHPLRAVLGAVSVMFREGVLVRHGSRGQYRYSTGRALLRASPFDGDRLRDRVRRRHADDRRLRKANVPAINPGPLVPSLGVRVVMFLDESAECRRCA